MRISIRVFLQRDCGYRKPTSLFLKDTEVADVTCNVFGGTLNLAQSINHGSADTNDDIPANSLLYQLLMLNDQMKFFELMAVMFLSAAQRPTIDC